MKIGFLPLYISLYDKLGTETKEILRVFYNDVAAKFEERGVEVFKCDICMEDYQFEKEIERIEANGCDAIVTLHLAYSPGLNSEKALANTKLPIIICDTTRAFDFSDKQVSSEISYCHGIHGVMDMCNLLKKNKKTYAVAAGHFEESDVLDRVVGYVKAAKAAKSLDGSRVGILGGHFDGMGDFLVDDNRMKELFGATVVYPEGDELKEIIDSVTDDEIKSGIAKDKEEFEFIEDVTDEIHSNSVKAEIALKKWVEKKNLQALTVNFLGIKGVLPTMPFTGICRLMAEQIGYAGEGDTLTALFTGALMQGFKDTSFIEIFCPDWKNDTLYISHMGEMNYNLVDKKPTAFTKSFAYVDCLPPVGASACFKPGNAVFVNVYEDEKGFNAFISPVKVIKETTDNFKESVRGWLDFSKPISEVLEKISECGATHHSILVYDANPKEIEFFAKCAGLTPVIY